MRKPTGKLSSAKRRAIIPELVSRACTGADRARPFEQIFAAHWKAMRDDPRQFSYAQLFLRTVPRYNQIVLKLQPHSRFLLASIHLAAAFWVTSCVAPLGPGYRIEKQKA